MTGRFAGIVGALVVVTIVLAISVGWLLAHSVQTAIGNPPEDLNATPVTFASDSGATVHGWWCPTQNAKSAVLLLPGIHANRLSMVDRARFLRRADYSVLLIDFQATGETTGDHITFGWKESRDVLAAATNFVRQTDPTAPVAIIGSFVGRRSCASVNATSENGCTCSREVYPTIEIATRNRMENYLDGFGRTVTPLLLSQLQWRLGVSASQLRPVDHIENVECPVFIISGENDRNTRLNDTRMLVARARNPKEIWFVPNAGHVDLYRAAQKEYETRVLAFLARFGKTAPSR